MNVTKDCVEMQVKGMGPERCRSGYRSGGKGGRENEAIDGERAQGT